MSSIGDSAKTDRFLGQVPSTDSRRVRPAGVGYLPFPNQSP
jgi:hypothetical protein